QHFAYGDPLDHPLRLARGETAERHMGHMRAHGPRGRKLGATSQDDQEARQGDLIDEEVEEFRVGGSNQGKTSITRHTGCRSAARSNQASTAASICCLWRWGVRVSGGYCSDSGKEHSEAKSGTPSSRIRPAAWSESSSLRSLTCGVSSPCHWSQH